MHEFYIQDTKFLGLTPKKGHFAVILTEKMD